METLQRLQEIGHSARMNSFSALQVGSFNNLVFATGFSCIACEQLLPSRILQSAFSHLASVFVFPAYSCGWEIEHGYILYIQMLFMLFSGIYSAPHGDPCWGAEMFICY